MDQRHSEKGVMSGGGFTRKNDQLFAFDDHADQASQMRRYRERRARAAR
jgi:hypothetical protein